MPGDTLGIRIFLTMTLGLFPLNLVLFPTVRIPLHIFEPRYRQLVGECLDSAGTFGINLVEHSTLHPVGCSARVVEVLKRYDDGRLDVVVEGIDRYKVADVMPDERAYLLADVEPVEDTAEPVDADLRLKALAMYNDVVDLVYGADGPKVNPEDDTVTAWTIAPKSGLDTHQKQTLLECVTENGRLELIVDHLTEILPTVRRAELVQKIIASDGYFPPA